jgi:hypothetical protein
LRSRELGEACSNDKQIHCSRFKQLHSCEARGQNSRHEWRLREGVAQVICDHLVRIAFALLWVNDFGG